VILQFIIFQFTNEHGTGAAIAFITTCFGAGQMQMIANKVKQYHAGRQTGFNGFIIENEFDQVPNGFFKVNEIRAKCKGSGTFLVRISATS
jgi:hypothetical protein